MRKFLSVVVEAKVVAFIVLYNHNERNLELHRSQMGKGIWRQR